MPIYEFLCEGCGAFEVRRSLEKSDALAQCPECAAAARRVYSMPNTMRISAGLSGAMDRAEKSAHEPEVTRRPEGGTLPGKRYRPSHGGHHGHNH